MSTFIILQPFTCHAILPLYSKHARFLLIKLQIGIDLQRNKTQRVDVLMYVSPISSDMACEFVNVHLNIK